MLPLRVPLSALWGFRGEGLGFRGLECREFRIKGV